MSLFETIMALVMVVAATGAVFGVGSQTARMSRQTEARAIAMTVARQKIDELAAQSFQNRIVSTDTVFAIPADVLMQFPAALQDKVVGTYSISPIAGTKNLHQISVTISWRNMAAVKSADSSLTVTKIVSSKYNLSWTPYDGTTDIPDEDLFFTPPDPPTTTGGTTGSTDTGGSTGSDSGGDTGATTGSDTGSSTGSTDTTGTDGGGGGTSDSGGGSTGSDTGGDTSGGSTGATDGGGSTGATTGGFGGEYGDKWG